MRKDDFQKKSNLSSNFMMNLRKSEGILKNTLCKLCITLNRNIEDIVEFVPDN